MWISIVVRLLLLKAKSCRVTRQESPQTDRISGAPALVYKPPAKWDEMSFVGGDRWPLRNFSTLEHVPGCVLRQYHANDSGA